MLLDLPLLEKSVSADLRIGFEMLTASGGISVEEGSDKPCVVVAAIAEVAATNLPDLAGEEDQTMSLDLQGWRISDRGEMWDLDFAPTQSTLYTVGNIAGR
jgi:hypothetical protein